MPKTIKINEAACKRILQEEYVQKSEVKDMLKRDKDLEKRIKNIVADSFSEFFKIMWQRRNFYDGDIRN